MHIYTCVFSVLLLLALLVTSCARVETNHTRGDQKHGACLICHVGRQQKAALRKAKKYQTFTYNNIFTQIYSPYLLRILVCTHIWLYVFKIRMVIWVEKQPSRGSSNFHDLGFPSTFIAALARSHAAKQRFTSSDCEFLKLMRFSSRNLRDFVPSLLDEILYAELF